MTGPEHYREAERLAAESYHEDRWESADKLLARAQIHATLALAAATAMNGVTCGEGLPVWDADAWQDTAGTQPEVGVPAEMDGAS